jgi:hypothetical protein
MQRLLTIITVAVLLWARPTGASAQDGDAKAIIQKALQAQGGVDKLTSPDGSYRKIKGVFYSDNFKFTGESWNETGNRLKIVLRGADDNDPQLRILVQNGAAGWNGYNGFVWAFDEPMKKRMAKSAYADKVTGLVSLTRDKGYTLTILPASTVKGTMAVGVKVRHANQNDVDLYFDKTRGLLIKSAYHVVDFNTNQDTFQEVYYSNFQVCDPMAADLQTLQSQKQATDHAALLKFLQDRIPTRQESEQIAISIDKLGDVKFATRQKASTELQKWGSKAAAQLRKLLTHDDREVARRAEQLLDTLAKGSEPALTAAVLRVLALRHPEDTVEAFLSYLPWACDETAAREVLNALVVINEAAPKPHPVLLATLMGADAVKRNAAAAVLGKDGGAFLKQPGRRLLIKGLVFAQHVTIYRDGKLYLEYDSYDQQFYNRFDDSLFGRP